MTTDHRLDAHTRPPESMQLLFKRLQKSSLADIEANDSILGRRDSLKLQRNGMRLVKYLEAPDLLRSFSNFVQNPRDERGRPLLSSIENTAMYEVEALPGQLDISRHFSVPA